MKKLTFRTHNKKVDVVILLFCACLSVSLNGFAQRKKSNTNVGLKMGTNLATISGFDDASLKLGFQVGLFGELELTHALLLRPEFIISNQGAKSDNVISKNYYLNFPIMFVVAEKNSPVKFITGLQVGTPIYAQYKYLVTNETENVTAQLNNLDISLAIGVEFNLSKITNLEFRYTHGLKNTLPDIIGESKFFNRVLLMSFNLYLNK